MKRNLSFNYTAIIAIIIFSSCVKQIDKAYRASPIIEFDATALNSVTAPFTHPLLIQIPQNGIPVTTLTSNCSNAAMVEPFLKRTSGAITLRVNLVGPTEKTDREIEVTTFSVASQIPSLTFRQPSPCSNVTLTTTDAVAGTHFSLASNKITVLADSSFGYLTITILNAGATANQARVIGFELTQTSSLDPSENYKKIAIAIDQR